MAEFLTGLKRTSYCAEVVLDETNVTVMGWVETRRAHGGLVFVDLRDRTGIIQCVFDESKLGDDFAKVERVRNEYVLAVEGRVRARSAETVNPKLKTGGIEIEATALRILSEAETPPFMVDDCENVNEALKLKHRYLELRNPRLQQRLIKRSQISAIAHQYLQQNSFVEIETPFLGKSTPEGARDYLVPSRVHKGAFYALPQSPQLFKQLLMISGFDRYYQVARCFRDEDLRANRQPEFTQIDLEMSFVDSEEDVMEVAEGLVKDIFSKVADCKFEGKFRRIPYQEAMDRFGSDKPDTRFGLELIDVSDIAKDCGFQVFTGAVARGGSVRMINAKGFGKSSDPILSRRDIDALTDFVKTYRAKGLAWIAIKEDGIQSVITKFMPEQVVEKLLQRAGAEVGDILFFSADTNEIVYNSLGALRLHLAERAGLIDKSTFDFLWVTDFPLLEYDSEAKRYTAKHHPFTSPKTEDLPLLDTAPDKVRAKAYDLVINGQEAGGGSIRIHSREVQAKMFNVLGFTDAQIEERFGFFVNAFKYGTPPHGGLAFGLDRLVMLATGTDNIKEVIAFPKVQNASDLMTEAPAPVEQKQLDELYISIEE